MRIFLTLFTLTYFLFGIAPYLHAQEQNPGELKNHQDFDTYSVHYSFFDSTFVPPDIAAIHNIKRSKYENLVNISISKKGEYGALPARITGTSRNLMQQVKPLEFIEIKEETATYYLAPIRLHGKEILHFSIQVIPHGETTPLEVNFTKTLYSE